MTYPRYGLVLVRDKYDDGGVSSGTLERPGLRRLLEDIEDGLIDVVAVYKIDRLILCDDVWTSDAFANHRFVEIRSRCREKY